MAKKSARRKKVSHKKAGVRTTTPASSSIETLDTAELQREIARRQRQVGRLHSKRDRLLEQVAEIDRELAALGSAGVAPGRKRPRNEKNLADALVELLTGQTMSVTEAAEAVQRAGYATTSANFRTIVNQTLLRDRRFKKVARGQYTAK